MHLKIVTNRFEMRKVKLQPKVEGLKTQKNKPQNITKLISEHPKNSFYVALLLLEFKMICRTEGGAPIAF